jgi:hypothetical protein
VSISSSFVAAAAAVQDLAKTDKGLSEALQAGGVEEEAADKAAHTADTTKETDAEDKGGKKKKRQKKQSRPRRLHLQGSQRTS